MSNLNHKLESVYLWAINTGELYKTHCTMAREKQSPLAWYNHVKETVIPRYRKETKDRDSTFTREERQAIADLLRTYYTADSMSPVTAAELAGRGVDYVSVAQRLQPVKPLSSMTLADTLPAACPAAESVPVYISKPEAIAVPAAAWDVITESGPLLTAAEREEIAARTPEPDTWKNPNPPYTVDGIAEDGSMQGDGERGPFEIFDTLRQEYISGKFPSRELAQAIADLLNVTGTFTNR